MRIVFAIIISALLPTILTLVFSIMSKSKTKAHKRMTDQRFVLELPKMIATIGLVGDLVFTVLIVAQTIFSKETPHIVFYIFFGFAIWIGAYLALKTLLFRVVVSNEKIIVHDFLRKPYEFMFSDIRSVVRQTKRTYRGGAERMIIRTSFGKKLVVEYIELSYERLLKRIKSDVPHELLSGFD